MLRFSPVRPSSYIIFILLRNTKKVRRPTTTIATYSCARWVTTHSCCQKYNYCYYYDGDYYCYLLPVLPVTRVTIWIGGCLLSFFVAVIVVVLSFWVRVGEGKARARMTGRKERSKAKRQKHKRRHARAKHTSRETEKQRSSQATQRKSNSTNKQKIDKQTQAEGRKKSGKAEKRRNGRAKQTSREAEKQRSRKQKSTNKHKTTSKSTQKVEPENNQCVEKGTTKNNYSSTKKGFRYAESSKAAPG